MDAHVRLNKEVCSSSVPALGRLVLARSDSFNVVNCVSALQTAARSHREGHEASPPYMRQSSPKSSDSASDHDRGWWRVLVRRCAGCLARDEAVQPRHVGSTLWACAKLGASDETGLLRAAVAAGLALPAERFKPVELSLTVWALGKLHFVEAEALRLVKTLLRAARARRLPLSAQGVANVLHGLGGLPELQLAADDAELTFVLGAFRSSLDAMKPQEAANALAAAAKLGAKFDPSFFAALERYLLARRRELQPRHVANLAWAVAKLQDGHDFAVVDFAKAFDLRLPALNLQEVSMCVWACSVMLPTDASATSASASSASSASSVSSAGGGLASLLARAGAEAGALTTQQLATIALASAKLNAPAFLAGLEEGVVSQQLPWGGQDLADFCIACARAGETRLAPQLHVAAEQWLHATGPGTGSGAGTSTGTGAGTGSGSGSGSGAGAGAGTGTGASPNTSTSTSTSTSTRTNTNANTNEARHLSNVVWSLAKLKAAGKEGERRSVSSASRASKPPRARALMVLAGERAAALAAEMGPRDLANLCWGLATALKTKCDVGVMRRLGDVAAAQLGRFNAQECSKLLYAFDKAGVAHPALQGAATLQRTDAIAVRNLGEPIRVQHLLGGGRALQRDREGTGATGATGGAVWESAVVLAEWMAKVRRNPAAESPALGEFLGSCDANLAERFATWDGKSAVELGAGVGLCAVAANKLGMRVTATDVDGEVLKLLAANLAANGCEETCAARALAFGERKPLKRLALARKPDVLLATGVVYGKDPAVWRRLADTIRKLCRVDTLVLLAHGNGAAPGVHRMEGPFYDALRESFRCMRIPDAELGSLKAHQGCQVHALVKLPRHLRRVSGDDANAKRNLKKRRKT